MTKSEINDLLEEIEFLKLTIKLEEDTDKRERLEIDLKELEALL